MDIAEFPYLLKKSNLSNSISTLADKDNMEQEKLILLDRPKSNSLRFDRRREEIVLEFTTQRPLIYEE